MSMSSYPAWHPWFGEIAIVLRRRAPRLSTSAVLIVSVLLLTVGVGIGWAHVAGVPLVSAGDRALAPLAKWPPQAALVIAAVVFVLVRARLQRISAQLRDGWWAAMPVDPRSRTVALSVAAGVVMLVCATVLMTIVGVLVALGARGASGTALAVIAAGATAGATAALIVVLRRPPAPHRGRSRVGVRHPLFATTWLVDRRLPHLSDWQRREALLRWRTHASATPVLAALVLMPAGASPLTLLGMLLFALSAGWLGVALRASIKVAASAAELLHSTPVSARQRTRAGLRYPAFACGCASIGGLLVAVAAGSWPLLVGWLALVAVLLVPSVPAAWRLIMNLRNHG